MESYDPQGLIACLQGSGEEAWKELAACRGMPTYMFFRAEHEDAAKQACDGCPVRRECLEYATEFEKDIQEKRTGVYGGLTGKERSRLYASD